MSTAIEWTDATWNPVTGCTKVSPGCANCYIERTPAFRMAGRRFVNGNIPVLLHPDRLAIPLRWRKPRMVFTCSMADMFHEDVPDDFIYDVFQVMMEANQHTFQVLTKRPERMRTVIGNSTLLSGDGSVGPLPNVWCGVSVENQHWADERIPLLLETPAAVRFLSCEPLLGPLELTRWTHGPTATFVPAAPGGVSYGNYRSHTPGCGPGHRCGPGIDWVIVGGESGGPEKRRLVEPCRAHSTCVDEPPSHLERRGYKLVCGECLAFNHWRPRRGPEAWVIDIRNQCQAACVPFFFKQWGGPKPKSGGRLLDGREWNEMASRQLNTTGTRKERTTR